MCVSNLSEFFKSCLSEFPGDVPDSVFTDFENAIWNRKYDVQDKTIIEAVLKEEGDSLKESFIEGFSSRPEWREGGNWDAEKAAGAVEVFCASLETLINYYYNNVIAGQFSGG